jgi:phospholipase/carboxylesterase
VTEILPSYEVEPGAPAEGSVVWLHGLGASGHDFQDVVPLLERPRARFVFPHAPQRAVTINMGLLMPAWYDVSGFGPGTLPDERGMRSSAERVEALLEREQQRGVPSTRTVLAGFSQGGALALHVGTRYAKPLLGLMVFSAYELLPATREAEASEANRATPILFCHGTLDPLVPVELGRAAHAAHAEGREARWFEFPMAHQMCLEELGVIRDWLARRFSEAEPAPG